ncbi:hypothetical protein E9529_08650 [Blastococcus sp. KM273128]|uniref:hypothetical protein n=1 Tax=Blastococcus sp. KM273128 TaxID=2570314 RepID=UPI001F3F53B1|nr:hypothetical protein [Blastococcus sp. KM273128]MCF6744343.1 hypothetical protein [Blastococcus sp. KM273128]
MSGDRLAHLTEVAPALWPTPHAVTVGRPAAEGAQTVAEYLLLPSARHPRLLAPTGRRAASAVVRHHGEGRHAAARFQAAVLALGLRAGLGPVVWRRRLQVRAPRGAAGGGLLDHLGTVLDREVVMGMHLGPPRANRKPVLQLLDPAGRTLAYAKLGVDALTDALVGQEAAALAALAGAGTGSVRVPELLHDGTWLGHRLLVQSALPVWQPRRPLDAAGLAAAAGEIAAIGRVDDVVLTASAYWQELRSRLDRLPDGPAAARLRASVDRIGRAAGGARLSFGASHGDWTPWNMAAVAGGLLVWDWERFRTAVPVGFDLLHHRLQSGLVARLEDPPAAAADAVLGAGRLLAPLALAPRTGLLTALLYSADLATRYLADRQLEAGARLGDVGAWLLPALDRGTTALEGETWT